MTLPGLDILYLKALLVASLAAWLMLAVINNILDFGTNRFLLGNVTSMRELIQDTNLGRGLIARAVQSPIYPTFILHLVIVAQVAIVVLLWRGAYYLTFAADTEFAVGAANLGLAALLGMGFFFLTGGLFYGYWIKMPQVQQVHLALVTITLGAIVLVNMA